MEGWTGWESDGGQRVRSVPDAHVGELRFGTRPLDGEAAVGEAADGGAHRSAGDVAMGAGRPRGEPARVGGERGGEVASRLSGGGAEQVGSGVPNSSSTRARAP